MLKYKIRNKWPEAKIEIVEVVRETEQCVFLPRGKKESRESKKTEWYEYHDTWKDAHDALLEKARLRVLSARRALELANGFEGNVKGMKEA